MYANEIQITIELGKLLRARVVIVSVDPITVSSNLARFCDKKC